MVVHDISIYRAVALRYTCEPETGLLRYKTHRRSNWIDRIAGYTRTTGYVVINARIEGKLHELFAHRLIWFMVHGEVPPNTVDHINGVKHDNRLSNLRLATSREQSSNIKTLRPARFSSSYTGVTYRKRKGNWQSRITVDKKTLSLGYYDTEYEAHIAYQNKLNSIKETL